MESPPLNRITAQAQRWLADVIRPGDSVLDATAGNGHDTLFLADTVGSEGHVLAVDIQVSALTATRERLESAQLIDRVTLLEADHGDASTWLANHTFRAAVFNLGYLPGGDHTATTQSESTLRALEATLATLTPGGRLVVVRYPGHEEGLRESEAVLKWASGLQKPFASVRYDLLNCAKNPPGLTIVERTS